MYLRNYKNLNDILFEESKIIKKYSASYDYVFFIVECQYARDLYFDYSIDRYDLMYEGNMGYNGSYKMVNEIDNVCDENSCVFYVDENFIENSPQFSKTIYNYIINNYNRRNVYMNGNLVIYTNN